MTCGIYAIIDLDEQRYVGSSVNIERRIKVHFKGLQNKDHQNRFLQRAYNKYGRDYFRVEILEECSKEILLEREQFYMDQEHKYNLSKKAAAGGIKWTIERKLKHSEKLKGNKRLLGYKHSEETKKKISESLKGRPVSENTRKAASTRMKKYNVESPNMKGRDFSEHHRKAISIAMKKHHKKE